MKFFIPNTATVNLESIDINMRKELKSQLGTQLSDKRIYSITYHHDKRTYRAEVGELEQLENMYLTTMIYESKVFIICTQDKYHRPSNTILVGKDEVIAMEEFDDA